MLSDSPKLSIITVVFNGAGTIQKTINSVICQTFQDIEYVIVDGGSTDGTLEIIKNNASGKIVLKSEPDHGIYDAMNKGIRMATGEWLYFLGSDDYFYNESVLENIFNQVSADVDIVYGNVFDLTLKRKYDGVFDLRKLLLKNICHQGIFYRKKVFETIGFYNIDYRLFADWDFNIRCFQNPEIHIRYVDETIAYYAIGGASAAFNDVPFFRNSLFPIRLMYLENGSQATMKSIVIYDQWWRLLRSCRIKKDETLENSVPVKEIPKFLQKMYLFQRIIPFGILRMGIFSKSFMMVSYILNRIF